MSDTLYSSVESVITDSGKRLLGVNLAILPSALQQVGRQVSTVQPWEWNIEQWVIISRASEASSWTLPPTIMTHTTVPDLPGTYRALVDATKASLEGAGNRLAAVGAVGAGTPSLDLDIGQDLKATPAVFLYRSMLMQMSASSYPVPQNLNLAFFLEPPVVANEIQFAALPQFTFGNARYIPIPPATTHVGPWNVAVQPVRIDPAQPLPAGAVEMIFYSDFRSLPEAGGSVPKSLWIDLPVEAGTLVGNWPSHLLEITAPYLNAARAMASVTEQQIERPNNVPPLHDGVPPVLWPTMRDSFRKALFVLFSTGIEPPPSYADFLRFLTEALGTDMGRLPVLNVPDATSRASQAEVADLRAVLTGITSAGPQIRLLRSMNGLTIIPTPLQAPERAAELTRYLELQLAALRAPGIASAVSSAADPTNLDDVAKALAQGPLKAAWLGYPEWATAFPKMQDWLQDGLTTDLRLKAYGTSDATGKVSTTDAAPLILPVMKLQSSSQTSDPLTGMRGVGVLMRRLPDGGGPAPDWSCLNLAVPLVADAPDQQAPLLVPIRPVYAYDLLTAYMPYSNSPLPTDDLLHRYLSDANQLHHDDTFTALTPLLQYAPYEGTDPTLRGVPELRAGATYEVASFAVSNAGALPVALRDGYPAKYRQLPAAALPGAVTGHPASTKRPISYYRTVPVGNLVEESSDGVTYPNATDLFPKIPATVVPRAGDARISQNGGTALPADGDPPAPHPPLLLVTPTASRGLPASAVATPAFSYQLKLPSLEPLTWDRTQGYTLSPNDRANILDAVYRRLSRGLPSDITDPLVDTVTFKLFRWNAAAPPGAWEAVPTAAAVFKRTDLAESSGLRKQYATVPLVVSVDGGDGVGTKGRLSIGKAGGTVVTLTSNLLEGEVYRLEGTLNLSARVAQIMKGHEQNPVSYQLMIEIGSALMPVPQNLPARFTAKAMPVRDLPDQQVQVRLPVDFDTVWKNVHRVDILRQSWSWTGRTQPRLYATVPPATVDLAHNLAVGSYPADAGLAAEWTLIEFADRPATDHTELSSTWLRESFCYDQDMSLDLRATLLRFAPRVFSRYEGLFTGTPDSPRWYQVDCVGDATQPDLWKPTLIRSRVRTLSMPRLKALIPLTESAFVPGTPGVMAIFDGPAYDQAGFAEKLHVGIAKVRDPDDPTVEWLQAGPDFLMRSDPAMPQVTPNLLVVGPIGHTLDPDVSGAKFLSHSYIIRPVGPDPEQPDQAHDFAWWFANLEFSLQIDAACSVFNGTPIESEKTVGSWTQFLPGFQDSTHHAFPADLWRFRFEIGKFTVLDEKRAPVSRNAANERHVRHYLLVTRRVLDISGTAREGYLGVAEYHKELSGWTLLGFPTAVPASQMLIRFMDLRAGEMGSNVNAPNPPLDDVEFWKRATSQVADAKTADDYRSSPVALGPVIKWEGYLQ